MARNITRKIYVDGPEYRAYLRARFTEPRRLSFEFEGHRWAYQYTSFDDSGDYELIWRPANQARAEAA